MNIYIVGGGASGMFLSILLKRTNPEFNIVVLEKNDQLGRKLLATGNGRCNYTNREITRSNFHSNNLDKAWGIIQKFDNNDVINKFKSLGIFPKIESDGRVFPFSLEGSSVVELLKLNMDKLGVTIMSGFEVTSIANNNGAIEIRSKYHRFLADKCIIATGGLTLPNSGSDGKGYNFASSMGHTVIDQTPAIVQLESDYESLKYISGVRIDTSAKLIVDGSVEDERQGDVLFTNYGLSGPAILDLSREAIKALNDFSEVSISINLLGIKKDDARILLNENFKNFKEWSKEELLLGIVHSKLIKPVIKYIDQKLGEDWIVDSLTHIDKICELLVEFNISITGYKDYQNAQATTGGVSLEELSNGLESLIWPGVYFIGEVVDVDGDCGGFNLQWAWSSSYAAYKEIALE